MKLRYLQQISVIALTITALLSLVVKAAPTGSERWYAGIYLLSPTNAREASCNIYIYDNHICEDEHSFVCFRLVLCRYDAFWHQHEWLEVGYYEDHEGMFIYAARYLFDGNGYHEEQWWGIHGEGENGEDSYHFSIAQDWDIHNHRYIPHSFTAYLDHMYPLLTAEFNIDSENYWHAMSESNCQENTLNGHYDELTYDIEYSDDVYDQPWQDIEIHEDNPPYIVTMVSTDEFYTSGGYWTPPSPKRPPSPRGGGLGGGRILCRK